jgi:hypothetical protein
MLGEFYNPPPQKKDDDDDRSVSLHIYAFGQKVERDLTITAGDVDSYQNCK